MMQKSLSNKKPRKGSKILAIIDLPIGGIKKGETYTVSKVNRGWYLPIELEGKDGVYGLHLFGIKNAY